MRQVAGILAVALLAACGSDLQTAADTSPAVRLVNGYTTPVDVVVDGVVALQGVAAGSTNTVAVTSGAHSVALRTGTTVSAAQAISAAAGALPTIAAIRASSGALSATVLDDTNSVVPAGATKLRVLHLAPNAGEVQVYRTQPDFPTPVRWQFPFTYQVTINSLSAPFYQSTPGTWEVRVWQSPADASGWGSSTVRATIPLASGEKKTLVILDAPGGGVRLQVL